MIGGIRGLNSLLVLGGILLHRSISLQKRGCGDKAVGRDESTSFALMSKTSATVLLYSFDAYVHATTQQTSPLGILLGIVRN
jgi:hypothetical protein